jgi:hypothetical protein
MFSLSPSNDFFYNIDGFIFISSDEEIVNDTWIKMISRFSK